jgi:hypothetical protein
MREWEVKNLKNELKVPNSNILTPIYMFLRCKDKFPKVKVTKTCQKRKKSAVCTLQFTPGALQSARISRNRALTCWDAGSSVATCRWQQGICFSALGHATSCWDALFCIKTLNSTCFSSLWLFSWSFFGLFPSFNQQT